MTSSWFFLSTHLDLIFDRIEYVLFPLPCFYLSAALLIFNKFSAFRKHFVPAKGLCCGHCIISRGLLKLLCAVVALSPILTPKVHTATRCSMLPFPRQDSQTHPYPSSTYSTLYHCKAMPLQAAMEEGPRSKAVCVSRLQYCQHS